MTIRAGFIVAAAVVLVGGARSFDLGAQSTGAGASLYGERCSGCHGADGKGGVAPEGVNAPRNFRDAAFQASRSDEQLKQAIRKGVGAMPGFGNLFSELDLQGLVRKIRSFDPGAKKP